MRNDQRFLVYHTVSVEKDIQVECSRRIGKGAHSAAGNLCPLADLQQVMGRKPGFQSNGDIEEPWLVGKANRLGYEIRRYSEKDIFFLQGA
jgi:hypothetical protein